MYNNLSFYKEIKGENVIDIEIYKFADKLLFSSDLKFYLDRFSNFDWMKGQKWHLELKFIQVSVKLRNKLVKRVQGPSEQELD